MVTETVIFLDSTNMTVTPVTKPARSDGKILLITYFKINQQKVFKLLKFLYLLDFFKSVILVNYELIRRVIYIVFCRSKHVI